MLSVLCISCVEALESEDSFAILSVMPKCEGERVNVCCVDIETKHSRNRRREREQLTTRGRVFNRMNRHFRGFLVSFRVLYLLLPSKNFWTADVKKLFTVGVYFILERGLLVDVELLGGGG
jgi:hypothetical protein